ncbi:ABC transporter substrate-binding protein [Undibacterium sp.]|jgi:branched-chain amino acid transport system substrate-binding protein|uniref:ABC transporter substrate-binding protein n=1 Tax=Undibacterium sp. TaxID=1914977 RepID=UPI002C86CD99|nr:ABC transporter substrate-binding protein [Undibacterium sp.]HTD03773.1 ABC transporter substrate-binding protein [Undibacterium sp.]
MQAKFNKPFFAIATAIVAALNGLPAQAQIKIGFITTLSGPGAALGQDQYDAFMLAVEQRGGKLGDAAIQVLKEDDQLKPDVAVQIAQKLIEKEKVNIVTGIVYSNVMMAIHQPISRAGIFLIGSNAGPAPMAGTGCSPYFFSTSWNNDQLHEAGGQLATNMHYRKMYLMAPNYQGGKDALSGFKRYYKGIVLDEIYTQVNQPDYSVEIAQMQAAKPDAVYVFYPGGMGVNFIKQYRQAGLLGKLPLLSVSTVDGTTLPALKDIAIGAITSSPYAPDLDNAQNKAFVASFQKKYGRLPSLYAAQSYDAAMLLDSAIRKVKGDLRNKEAFRAALKQADFKSVRGPFKYNSNQFPIANFYRVDVIKGADGHAMFSTKGVILENHKDGYAQQCAMK